MGFIDFTNGEVLTADQMDLVMRQGVMRFADASARDTALSEVLAEGMMAYLDDTNEVLKYDGTSWIDISGDITGVTAGTALTGGGTSGNVTINADISALSTAQAGNALNANGELLDVDESALTIAQSQVTDLVSDLADKQDDVITTQGDLVIGDASGDPVRLPVGTADQVLTSDGTTVSFQDAGVGGGLTQISSTSLSGSQFNITSIPGDYKHLQLVLKDVDSTNSSYGMQLRLNGISTGNLYFGQSASETGIASEENKISLNPNSEAGTEKTQSFIEIFNYADNGDSKQVVAYTSSTRNSFSNQKYLDLIKGTFDSSLAVTEINIILSTGTFNSGTAILYGVS